MTSTPQPSASMSREAIEIALRTDRKRDCDCHRCVEHRTDTALAIDALVSARVEALERRQRELVDMIYHAWDSSKHPAVGVSMALNRLTPAELSQARERAKAK